MIEAIASADREIWSRRSVVRGHIDCSIGLLFESAPKSSVNLLAAAAVDVLNGILDADGKISVADSILDTVPQESRKLAIRLFKHPYNFSKHADKDPGDELDVFSSFCEFIVFMAISDYKMSYQQWSVRMLIFAYWFRAKHASWLENYRGDVELHSIDWFESDLSFGRANSIVKHFDERPDEVRAIMLELGQNWIEFQ